MAVVTRMWTLGTTASPIGRSGAPWVCQLIRAAVEGDVLVLDLVALEHRDRSGGLPALQPFTLHARKGRELAPGAHEVAEWAAVADVVTLIPGRSGGIDWLCLRAGNRHLVLELLAAT